MPYRQQYWNCSCGAACLQEASYQRFGQGLTMGRLAVIVGQVPVNDVDVQRMIYWMASGTYLNVPYAPGLNAQAWGYSMPAYVAYAAWRIGFNVTIHAKQSRSYYALRLFYPNAINQIRQVQQVAPAINLNIGGVLPPIMAGQYRIRVHAWRQGAQIGLHYILYTSTEYMDPAPGVGGSFVSKAAWFGGTNQPGPTFRFLKRSWATGIDVVLT